MCTHKNHAHPKGKIIKFQTYYHTLLNGTKICIKFIE